MKLLFFTITIIILCFSCKKKKEEEYILHGIVKNINTGEPVNNMQINLLAQKFIGSSYNDSYTLVAYDITKNSGNYNIVFKKERVASYKIVINEEKYFNNEIELPNKSFENKSFEKNIGIYSKSWIKIVLINHPPSNPEDILFLRFMNNPIKTFDCCPSTYKYFYGVGEHILPPCEIPGSFNAIIELNYSIGANHFQSYDTIPTSAFDTITHIVGY